ncbi:MAG: tyrosine-type recombinase/integrase [Gaiellaceae bacterium]
MPAKKTIPADASKRHTSRYRGISYRECADGSRRYSVFFQARYIAVEGGEGDALAYQAELRGKAARGELPAARTRASFGEVAEAYIASKHRLRAGTWKTYRATLDRILIPRFGETKIGALSVEHVAALIRDLERQQLAPTTIQSYLMPLRGVMGYAVRRGLISVNPCDLLTRDDRPQQAEQRPDHIWSDQEIEALINAAEQMALQPEARYDYSPLIRTALLTGLRLGELLGLQWQDIDLHEGILYVRRQWTRAGSYGPTKTKAGLRRVPLSPDMLKYLTALKLRSRYSDDAQPVFASQNGETLGHRNSTRRGFEKAAKLAKLEDVSFHDMRHAFASRMIDQGISSTVLAKIMGHETSAITEKRYIHLFDQQRTDDAVRQAMAW